VSHYIARPYGRRLFAFCCRGQPAGVVILGQDGAGVAIGCVHRGAQYVCRLDVCVELTPTGLWDGGFEAICAIVVNGFRLVRRGNDTDVLRCFSTCLLSCCAFAYWCDTGVSAKCISTLTGHESAVWDALLLPSSETVVTCSADRTLKLWSASTGKCTSTVSGHTDVVRSLSALPFGGVISVANDSSARLWKSEPSGGLTLSSTASDVHDGNFIYTVDARVLAGSGDRSAVTVISGGEDNALRVSGLTIGDDGRTLRLQTVQTVTHPGSVWSVALSDSGDLITGCSDGVARLFTRDPSRVAAAGALEVFEASVAARQVSTKLIGGVDAKKLPLASEALAVPGVKDGENKMVRRDDGDGAEVHMWSAADGKWSKVGDIVDGPGGDGGAGSSSGSGGSVRGVRYDYVFDVDVAEGQPKLKLGYNRGEDTYVAAQRFIDDNELSQEFLDQTATFIESQAGVDATTMVSATSSDPLTGGGRYIPGSGGGGQGGGGTASGNPLMGGRYIPGGGAPAAPSRPSPPPRKLIPHADGIITLSSSDQLGKIGAKLAEFHAALGGASISDEEMDLIDTSLLPKLGGGSSIRASGPGAGIVSDEECAAVEALLAKWPTSHVFPALDIARLLVATPSGSACLFGRRNGVALTHILRHVATAFPVDSAAMTDAPAPKAPGAVALLACRFVVNLFHNRVVGSTVRARQAEILPALGRAAGAPDSAPRARDTFAALLLNYAVALSESRAPVADRAPVLEAVIVRLRTEKEEPVAFRLAVALGTLMTGDDKAVVEAAMSLGAAAAVALAAPLSSRCQQVATEIATVIAVD